MRNLVCHLKLNTKRMETISNVPFEVGYFLFNMKQKHQSLRNM